MMICRICSHPDRAAIDRAIVEQRSLRNIAKQFGVHQSSVNRHKAHIPDKLVKAKQVAEISEATSLLSEVQRFKVSFESAYDEARRDGEWSGAAALARQLLSSVELLAKLSGELQPGGTRVAINFGDVTKIDIGALTDQQLSAIYARLNEGLTSDDLGQRLMDLLSEAGIMKGIREMLLFDNETVSPEPGYEANNRHNERAREDDVEKGRPPRGWKPWRSSGGTDRLRMLQALWKRLTGFELDIAPSAFGQSMAIQVEFDLRENVQQHWTGRPWPTVKLVTFRITEDDQQIIEGQPPARLPA